MTKETKTIALTAEQLKKQGLRTTDAMARLSMLRNYANTLMLAMHNKTDTVILQSCLEKFVSDVYDQSSILCRELDHMAIYLLECDDLEELKAYGIKIEGDNN